MKKQQSPIKKEHIYQVKGFAIYLINGGGMKVLSRKVVG